MQRRHLASFVGLLLAWSSTAASPEETDAVGEARLAEERLALMRTHALAIQINAPEESFPTQLVGEPLFRYDDHTRGYIDGAVWRLGETGRPLAIITTELHPKYLGSSPRIVYDLLSVTTVPFSAKSSDVLWTPGDSAVRMQPFPDGPTPAANAALRTTQMKALCGRLQATQDVEGQKVQLRLLPKPIDRYAPLAGDERADGAVFVYCNGRNPAILLFLETDGQQWRYGFGRLSLPSDLVASLDGDVVWRVEVNKDYGTSSPYNASNYPVVIPGYEAESPPLPTLR
jgi:hypothetical protein